jgi:hypothetical protein
MTSQRTTGRSAFELLALILFALPMLYGLKCILTLQAKMPFPQQYTSRYSWHFTPVQGTAAIWTGLGWIGLGLFANLSVGRPPPENRRWFWRVLRWGARWGSLVAAWWSWDQAGKLMSHRPGMLKVIGEMITSLPIDVCLGIVALLWFLFAMLFREAVKRELHENRCKPLHIWWQPFAYWSAWFSGCTSFRVAYRDPAGFVHNAYCYVYINHFWARRLVRAESPGSKTRWFPKICTRIMGLRR